MDIRHAQRDVRHAFLGGLPGQLVSAAVWLASASVYTWISPRAGVLILLGGGALIFPLTLAWLRATSHPAGLPPGHPMNALGRQVALALPLGLPVALGAAAANPEWLYPAVTVLLGAHYLPFAFLYGMRMFVGLAAVLVAVGLGVALAGAPGGGVVSGWITAGTLVAAAALGGARVRAEMKSEKGTRSAYPARRA